MTGATFAGEPFVNVLRAIDVPSFNLEQDGTFDLAGIGCIVQAVGNAGFLGGSGITHNLMRRLDVVHQKDKCPGVLKGF